ncbi:MAG: YceI family protein [Rhodothalassiaceae bacterium]
MRKALLIALLLLAACDTVRQGLAVLAHHPSADAGRAAPGRYRIDPQHSSVHFSVMHLGFSHFTGRFDDIAGTLDFVPTSPTESSLDVHIKAASVNSNATEIDALLREKLFGSDRYPDIRYTARKADLTGEREGIVHGELQMAGRRHPLDLEVVFNGAARNPLTGAQTLGFSARATLDRSDWGIGDWYPAVAQDVEIRIEAEFVLDEAG